MKVIDRKDSLLLTDHMHAYMHVLTQIETGKVDSLTRQLFCDRVMCELFEAESVLR